MPGLVVRKDNGDLRWYPLFNIGDRYTFFPPEKTETGKKVGDDWNFVKYLPGYWEPGHAIQHRRRIGGGSNLVVLEDDGDLKYYPFKDETFMIDGTGRRVGRGFSPEWDYYVAEWMDNGTSDLIVRDEDGDLLLYPWNGREFEDLGRSKKVGRAFIRDEYTELLIGHWTGSNYPDILTREEDGEMHLYPFNGSTFMDKGRPHRVGRGFGRDFTHFFADEWLGNGTPDLIVRKRNNDLVLYPFGLFDESVDHPVFKGPPYEVVGRGFKDDWIYLPGYWRTPGHPDLILVDGENDLRFYPFEEGRFVDLDDDLKKIGDNWKFTHFWDFYPV